MHPLLPWQLRNRGRSMQFTNGLFIWIYVVQSCLQYTFQYFKNWLQEENIQFLLKLILFVSPYYTTSLKSGDAPRLMWWLSEACVVFKLSPISILVVPNKLLQGWNLHIRVESANVRQPLLPKWQLPLYLQIRHFWKLSSEISLSLDGIVMCSLLLSPKFVAVNWLQRDMK